MKKLILLFLLPVVWLSASGQDRLEPAPSAFDEYNCDHNATICKKLFNIENDEDYYRKLSFWFLIDQTFFGPECFEVFKDGRIVYKEATGNKTTTTIRRKLDTQSYDLLQNLFFEAVVSARFPSEKPKYIIFDGHHTYFSVSFYGCKTAYAHSPREGTNAGAIEDICKEVIVLVKNSDKKTEISLPAELISRIETLTAKFKDLR